MDVRNGFFIKNPCVFDAKIIGNGLYVCALGGVSRLEIP